MPEMDNDGKKNPPAAGPPHGPPEFPPLPFVSIFQLNQVAPTEPVPILQRDLLEAVLHPGPIAFRQTTFIPRHSPPSVVSEQVSTQRFFKPGSYLLIHQYLPSNPDPSDAPRASIRADSIAALFETRFQGIVITRAFEGVIDPPNAWVWHPMHPMTMTARPATSPEEVATSIGQDLGKIEALDPEERARFQLAARWFLRGVQADDPLDRFLYWWTVLELYMGGTKVITKIKKDLRFRQLCPDVKQSEFAARLGQLDKLRNSIVHDGVAIVENEQRMDALLPRMRALAVMCLRLWMGSEPSEDLRTFLEEASDATS